MAKTSLSAPTVLFRSTVAILVVLVVARIVRVVPWRHTLDDAFMFVRYADHLAQAGCVCWNVPGKPTYGLTSLAYLGVVVPVRLLLPGAAGAGATAVCASIVSGVVFLLLLWHLLARHGGATRVETRRAAALYAAGTLAIVSFTMCFHFSSGMDTMFATAALTGLLIGHERNEKRPTRALTVALGLATAFIFFARPDLLIYSVGIPATALVLARDGDARRRHATILGIGGVTLAGQLLFTSLYFGQPLPLPFYAKGLHSYTGRILVAYRGMAREHFAIFIERHWPLFGVLLVAGPYVVRQRGWRAFTPVEIGIAASTAVFLTYYLFFVLQIMPHQSRFYFPTIGALFLLATRCVVLVLEGSGPPARWYSTAVDWMSERARLHVRWTQACAAGMLVALVGVTAYRGRQVVASLRELRSEQTFDVRKRYLEFESGYWYRLDEVSALPDDLVLGTTEVGIPSALNPGKTVVDLAGLNDADVRRQGFRINTILERYRPDFVYMPHPDYSDMNSALLGDPVFKEEYAFYPADQLGTEMAVALRRDSKYFGELTAIASKGPARH